MLLTGKGLPLDKPQGMDWLHKAADGGILAAQEDYVYVLCRENRKSEAAPYLEKGVAAGNPTVQWCYGVLLLAGQGVPQDRVRGLALLKTAAATGDGPARLWLMNMQRWRELAVRYARDPVPAAARPIVARPVHRKGRH